MTEKEDELVQQLREIKTIVIASTYQELKDIFEHFGFINYKQVGWNADRFGNIKGDETKARFDYILIGGDHSSSNCSKCFFVDYQLKTAKAMFKLYDMHNPNKNTYQTIPCIDNCKQNKDELTADDIELEKMYKELRAAQKERKLRIDSLKNRMIKQNRLIKQKRTDYYNKQSETLKAQDLIAEIDRWEVLSKMKEEAERTPEEEIIQTQNIVRLYNKTKADEMTELNDKEEAKRKMFEAFLSTYLKSKELREESDKIDAKIDTFLSLFNSTKYFLTVDFLEDPFDKVLQLIETQITKTPKTKRQINSSRSRHNNRTRSARTSARTRSASNRSRSARTSASNRSRSASNRKSASNRTSASNRKSNMLHLVTVSATA